MKIKTVLIAPYEGLKELATELAKEQDVLDISVMQADLKAALPIVKQLEAGDCQIIISRGGTAKLIRQQTSLPVVEIPVSGYDIMRTLLLVKDYNLRPQIIGFADVCQGAVAISNLLDIAIPHTIIQKRDEVEEAVQKAKKRGAQVIVGDTVTVNTAQNHGLQGMMITSGRESVLEAFALAEQVYNIVRNSERQIKSYENILDTVYEGMVIVDEEGVIFYGNTTFRKMSRLPEVEHVRISLADVIPGFDNLFQRLISREHIEDLVRVHEQTYQVEGKIFSAAGPEILYIFTFYDDKHPHRLHKDIQVNTLQPPLMSLYQINGTGLLLEQLMEEGKRFADNNDPVLVYGERGTGKELLAAAIHQFGLQQENDLLRIEIFQDSPLMLNSFREALQQPHATTFYIKGMERLSSSHQEEMVEHMQRVPGRFIFGFDSDPQKWVEEKTLAGPFYEWIKRQSLYLPPLRERIDEIHAYTHMFIAQNNVKYGKQIVGIRQPVIDHLCKQPWPGNLEELREVIEHFVQWSTGPYIEKDVLAPLTPDSPVFADHTQPIDLNQTLAEIEQDIIHYVLEEENHNQTKAAKRLGINRSTLWRKLK